LSIHILLLQKNSYADIQRLNLQLEKWTTLVCIVYLHGTSQKSNVGDNGLICKVTLSLGLLSPRYPFFQWYLQSKEIFIKSQIPGRGCWEVSKVDTRPTVEDTKITTVSSGP
jgi:hypothetical protein